MTFALTFGNDFSRYRYGTILEELYPDSLAYEKWGNYFYRFGNKIESNEINGFIEDGRCLLMRGSPLGEANLEEMIVDLERADGDLQLALYRVVSIK